MRGGAAKLTLLAGSPYPFAGLTLRVRAAEERGARFMRFLEEEEELEECGLVSVVRLRSLFVVGNKLCSAS